MNSLKEYAKIVGEDKIEALKELSEELQGIKMLELSSTRYGGGVAEMLNSSVPFLNMIGIKDDWNVIRGNKKFFEVTKSLHNLLQGKKDLLTEEMVNTYNSCIKENIEANIIDEDYDVVFVHDPQPLALARELRKPDQKWFWRCHIDIDEDAFTRNKRLWDFISYWADSFDAVIFSAAYFVVSRWPLPKFIIPPFIDPLSDKNVELREEKIEKTLEKYDINRDKPIISQIGRFDRWKDPVGAISIYKEVKRREDCQLIIAGGMASDDPEGEGVLKEVKRKAKGDDDIHILVLPNLSNFEINAIQRGSDVIMQNSVKEGFGLTVTEALWKCKPVITRPVGGIMLQIKDGINGFLISDAKEGADKIIYLLRNPNKRELMGNKGKRYVKDHFLLPERIHDLLLAIKIINQYKIPIESIISFHPWFKLSKRVW
ncbi:MAG: glycosyltransferase [Candidatus Methanolliviera hydrocarbonicum]|uniref:Glycosyltransferase n=1 Tax=Candidatus Methanolliviera hydrocarbonicum TaxID=2491085 RepID=A0A520KYA0_9EURY|nr:MAG: glycosyltransferase [Candidatus Methanolliviera hydrocarbonicum]